MTRIRIRLLGPFEVTIDDVQVTTFAYAKVRALLAYLAVERQQLHTRAELAALLWPDTSEQAARASLSQALATLRNAFDDKHAEQPLLLADTQHIQLNPASVIEVDVAQFVAILRTADAHAHHSWRTCSSCAERMQLALDLFRGDFLADLPIPDSAVFEEWASLRREHLRQRALSVLERLAERAQWRGTYTQALTFAERMVALEPLLEMHQRTYMRLLALNGELIAALAQYRQLQAMLSQELAAEPDEATTALFGQIRRGDIAGLQPTPAPFDVPMPPTPLVSRAAEVQAICDRLRARNVCCVTITGTGGIGKTRLAIETAYALRYDFEDGIYFVELAALNDATLVAHAIAQALGVNERSGRSIGATLRDHVRAKHLLLVLDNFEHVIAAAPLVSELLAASSGLTVLATSRAALNIRAEQQVTLEPLADTDAVQLFIQRAQAVGAALSADDAHTAVYSAICQRLDRLPLAIELIAVRARTLAPLELLRQLERPLQALVLGPRDVPARHQALRNAIQWSYDLLNPEEQHAFMRLGVFAGGCTAPAVQAVLGESIAALPVLEVLHQASLLRQQTVDGETRFLMLETIREFALEQLAAQEDGVGIHSPDWVAEGIANGAQHSSPTDSAIGARRLSIQQRHAAFFLALLEQAMPELSGSQRMQWAQRLKTELANLRVALQTLIAAQDAPNALRFVALLWYYWLDQGYLNEGRDWIDHALALANTSDAGTIGMAHHEALLGAAFMAFVQDDYAAARRRYKELLALAQISGQQIYTAKALDGLGTLVQCNGHLDEAGDLLNRSIEASRAVGDLRGEHWTLFNLAFVRAQQGEIDTARALFEQAVAFNRSDAHAFRLGNVLAYYAYTLAHQGDDTDARPPAEEALAIGIREEQPWMQQIALLALGLLAFKHHELGAARELFEGALVQSQRLGDRLYTATTLSYLGMLDVSEHAWGSAYQRLVEALDLARAISSPKAITLVFEGLASLWASLGEWERATQLFGAIEMLYLRRGARPAALTYKLQMPYVRVAYANLGAQRFALIWSSGQELTLEAAYSVASTRTGVHAALWNEGRAHTFEHVIDLALKPMATVERYRECQFAQE
jgi:predicted ATPase/DNA-binding SARP family transcriptional activator